MPASAAPVRSRATLFSRKVIYGEAAVWIDTLSRGPPRSSPCSPPLHPQIWGSGSISAPPQPLGREHRTANRRGALQASGAAASKATDSGLKTVETDSLCSRGQKPKIRAWGRSCLPLPSLGGPRRSSSSLASAAGRSLPASSLVSSLPVLSAPRLPVLTRTPVTAPGPLSHPV